jgi:hypothetical protein
MVVSDIGFMVARDDPCCVGDRGAQKFKRLNFSAKNSLLELTCVPSVPEREVSRAI